MPKMKALFPGKAPIVMSPSKRLKDLLTAKETLVMPDAYDAMSARIIEQAGFKAVQCSGYSFSVAACKKHETDIGLEENVAITAKIVEAVSVPVMADGEDGFGDVEQIPNTIERYVRGFTSLVAKGCLCSPQDIGRLIGA